MFFPYSSCTTSNWYLHVPRRVIYTNDHSWIMRSNLMYMYIPVLLNVTDLILSHQEHSYVVGLGDNSPWCVVFQNTMAN